MEAAVRAGPAHLLDTFPAFTYDSYRSHKVMRQILRREDRGERVG
jgi:hypothetical protein